MYTSKQFHKMQAYVETVPENFFNVRFVSYSTLMLYMSEKNEIMCARDYRGVATQKQMTIFLREYYGEKWLKAYKTAIKFYRSSFVNKKCVLSLWFYIQRDKNGHFHFTFFDEDCDECKIEFYL